MPNIAKRFTKERGVIDDGNAGHVEDVRKGRDPRNASANIDFYRLDDRKSLS